MIKDNYQLRYLPLFFDDVNNITSYIKNELSNPQAANKLIDAVEEEERKYPYYKIYVKNYVVYYVVIDDEESNKIMEVRRLLYNRQDREYII